MSRNSFDVPPTSFHCSSAKEMTIEWHVISLVEHCDLAAHCGSAEHFDLVEHCDLVEHYDLVEHCDLVEHFDLIEHFDLVECVPKVEPNASVVSAVLESYASCFR